MALPLGLIPPTADDVAKVYRDIGTNESSIREAKQILLRWLKDQPHLPDSIDDCRLEKLYINSKCSLERCKVALDAYFSLKGRLPEILQNRDPLRPDLQEMMDVIMIFPMPRLTPEGYRVLIVTHTDSDASLFYPEVYVKLVLMALEIRLAEDCVLGDVYVIDCKRFSVSDTVALGAKGVNNLELCSKTAYSSRIKGVHFINPTHIMDLLFKIIVHAMSPKLVKRVSVHKQQETLFYHVPPECVPNELGGKGGPAAAHWESWKKKMISYRDWFIEQDQFVSDETKRPGKFPYGDGLFGSEGSYRKLPLD